MKIKNEDQQKHPKPLKISEGQYEIIGPIQEDIQAAIKRAEHLGYQIVSKPKCHSRRLKIPPLFKYQRHTLFVGLESRINF